MRPASLAPLAKAHSCTQGWHCYARRVVLSVGKLAQGQERYYERQVARGADDYYSGRGEAPGEWVGRGSEVLGLEGRVAAQQLHAMAAGIDPSDPDLERPLRSRAGEMKVAGYDLTFSAPKSVSVLYATADLETSEQLVEAHEAAVRAALAYVEDEAVKVRRGKGGVVVQAGDGLVAAAYRHRLSRALDPQLHTHVVAANATRGPDGRWTALDARHIYRHAKTAGTLYQAHLRAEIRDRLGLEWGPVRKGAAELEGIGEDVRRHFSRRRQEMEAHADQTGVPLTSKGRGEATALATRDRKSYDVDTGTWRQEVQARAAEHGLDRAAVEELLADGRERDRGPVDDVDVLALQDVLSGPQGLTDKDNTFAPRDALRALAEAHQQGARVGDVRGHGDRFLARPDLLDVTHSDELDLPDEQETLYTTAELVSTERRLIAAAIARADSGTAVVPTSVVDRALAGADRPLTFEQEAAVRDVVTSGNGVDVVEALAGTGKTYTAGVLRQVFENNGRRVIGVAPTGRAVRELTDEAGVEAYTLFRTLDDLREHGLPADTVVLMDEAGMASTRETEEFLRYAETAGAKVVAIGDPGQLPSVQAGGWLRAIGERVGRHQLTQVMRQRDPEERRALGQLHDGNAGPYLRWAEEAGRVEVHANPAGALDVPLGEWARAVQEHGLADSVLIARDNDTRDQLNVRAREMRRKAGALGDDRDYGPVTIAVGDRVICRRNDARVDVDNGTRGTIRHAGRDGVVLETDAGTVRTLPAEYVADHVEPAYALTGHGMQGGTVEWAAVVAQPRDLTRGWSYTALSRARGTSRLHVVADDGARAQERSEFAPPEHAEPSARGQVLERVALRMTVRDDEDLAVDRLPEPMPAGGPNDPALHQRHPVLQEAAADRGEPATPRTPLPARRSELAELAAERRALVARRSGLPLQAVAAVDRHDAQYDRIAAQRGELADRLEALPDPVSRRFGADRDDHATERARLRAGVAAADEHLQALAPQRAALVRELGGDPAAVRDELAGIDQRIRTVDSQTKEVLGRLVDDELVRRPPWTTRTFGDRPDGGRQASEWERGVRAVASYELRRNPVAEIQGLSDEPDEREQRTAWRTARRAVEQVQRRLGRELDGPEREVGRSRD